MNLSGMSGTYIGKLVMEYKFLAAQSNFTSRKLSYGTIPNKRTKTEAGADQTRPEVRNFVGGQQLTLTEQFISSNGHSRRLRQKRC